jgi:hypothetical protein
MRGILADNNIERHVRILVGILQGPDWSEFWDSLQLAFWTFATLPLPRGTLDRDLWLTCQHQQLVLITANRNMDGEDSLEAAIRELNTPESLPVLTLAAADEVLRSSAYAEKIAARLRLLAAKRIACRTSSSAKNG